MSKNPKDIQPKDGDEAKELEQVETALEHVLTRQLAPTMLKLTEDNPAGPKEQVPGDQREVSLKYISLP